MRSVWERWTKIVPVFYIPSCKAGAPLSACVVCLQTIHMHSSLEPVRFGSRFFCLCGDTRKKIVAIQIALFSACVDTRKNSRDLNRDSNRAFLVCGNAPIMVVSILLQPLECTSRSQFGCIKCLGDPELKKLRFTLLFLIKERRKKKKNPKQNKTKIKKKKKRLKRTSIHWSQYLVNYRLFYCTFYFCDTVKNVTPPLEWFLLYQGNHWNAPWMSLGYGGFGGRSVTCATFIFMHHDIIETITPPSIMVVSTLYSGKPVECTATSLFSTHECFGDESVTSMSFIFVTSAYTDNNLTPSLCNGFFHIVQSTIVQSQDVGVCMHEWEFVKTMTVTHSVHVTFIFQTSKHPSFCTGCFQIRVAWSRICDSQTIQLWRVY